MRRCSSDVTRVPASAREAEAVETPAARATSRKVIDFMKSLNLLQVTFSAIALRDRSQLGKIASFNGSANAAAHLRRTLERRHDLPGAFDPRGPDEGAGEQLHG